jgi:arylsulfatase A-like enzyme
VLSLICKEAWLERTRAVFAHDDTNVIMLVSNPGLQAGIVTSFVETTQVAPTILQALGLDPGSLDAVQKEGTPVLPGLNFK